MKIKALIPVAVLAATLLVGCGGSDKFKDGTYKGKSDGLKGPIEVEVKVADGKLSDIVILDNKETETIFESIKEYLVPDMIKKNTSEVETVSGATTSSKAVIKAVGNALEEAK